MSSTAAVDQQTQDLLKQVLPEIATYLRTEIAPLLAPTGELATISIFDMARIKKLIGESIWQGGAPLLKPAESSYINPFAKALSTNADTVSTSATVAAYQFKPLNPQHLDSDSDSDGSFSSGGSLFSKHGAKHAKAKQHKLTNFKFSLHKSLAPSSSTTTSKQLPVAPGGALAKSKSNAVAEEPKKDLMYLVNKL